MDLTFLLSSGAWILDNSQDLVGFIIPILVELLNKEVKDEKERFIVTLLACLAAATMLKWRELSMGSVEAVLVSASIIFIQAQVVFKLYFKSSILRAKIQDKLQPQEFVIPDRIKK